MKQISLIHYFGIGLAVLAGLVLPSAVWAEEVSGEAKAVQATVLGVTYVLADTGSLNGADDARETSQFSGIITSLGDAKTLHATTVSSVYDGDDADFVASEASLGDLSLGVGGDTISADFVMAEAVSYVSGASTSLTNIEGLRINGSPVDITGAANQVIAIADGTLIINEQQTSSTGEILVNALHITAPGVDLVLASASAGATGGDSSQDSDPGLLDGSQLGLGGL